MSDDRGKLFVLSAPSGAGKTTLVKKLLEKRPDLRFSISYTTRDSRAGETDGVDYFFLDQAGFEAMIDANEFLEFAEVFGRFYGTGREQVEQLQNDGHDVLLEIDCKGAQQVRANQPDCCSIFILPPSVDELERRLRGRATDAEDVIRNRLGEAIREMSHWHEFDHVIVNDDVDRAAATLEAIMNGGATGTATADGGVRSRIEALLAVAASPGEG
jgi:guanylate kinase